MDVTALYLQCPRTAESQSIDMIIKVPTSSAVGNVTVTGQRLYGDWRPQNEVIPNNTYVLELPPSSVSARER